MADTATAALDDDDVELPLAPPLEEPGELPDEGEDEEEDAHAAGKDLQPAEQGGEGDQEEQPGVRCAALRPALHLRSGASRVIRDAGRSRLDPATPRRTPRGYTGSVWANCMECTVKDAFKDRDSDAFTYFRRAPPTLSRGARGRSLPRRVLAPQRPVCFSPPPPPQPSSTTLHNPSPRRRHLPAPRQRRHTVARSV